MRDLPISPYSVGKVASKQLLQMLHRVENFPVVIVRLFLVYGPGQKLDRFIPQVIHGCLSNKNFPVSFGEQLRDFLYIKDAVRGILMILTNNKLDGEVINLASGKPIKVMDMIKTISNLTKNGIPEFGKVPYRKGENMSLYADISKIQKMLDWNPEVSLNEGLSKTITSYKDKYDY